MIDPLKRRIERIAQRAAEAEVDRFVERLATHAATLPLRLRLKAAWAVLTRRAAAVRIPERRQEILR